MKKFEKTLAAVKGTEILAVVEGLPVTANGFFVTEEQLNNIEAALVAGDTATASLTDLQTKLTAAEAAKAKVEGELATANTKITELEKEDAAKPTAPSAEKDVAPVVANDDSAFLTSYDREMAEYKKLFQ